MEYGQQRQGVLTEAVEVAEARLGVGDELMPILITDRWGDIRLERFDADALSEAKARFGDFLSTAAGVESCALVYLGRAGDGEEAIVIERGQAGDGDADVFVQRFRPRRGRFRGFKLIGKPEPVSDGDVTP